METEKFLNYFKSIYQDVMDHEVENIKEAAAYVTNSCEQDGRLYVFGSGHSHMIAEEIYIRAGGLAFVKAILPTEVMLHEMPNKSTFVERLTGYSESLLDLYKVEQKDTLMVVSNSGRNNVPVEMCLAAKKKGMKVIAITSVKGSKDVASRHASGKKISDVADVTIDNHAPKGDAGYYIENFQVPVGGSSDFTGIAIAQALITTVVSNLVQKGIEPPVFRSSNVDGADDYNNQLFETYYGYWK
ncbi:Phosphoheptose isomerase [Paraliobacillus sp. PM-2]|uniref:SIS domain-containing protein n=1 Tax=Paraliobacillus sp. PM-2 TaxID=1462524 RepID=UPI00061C9237|nr:SIS domain-containing protein [Paraliobacillus sp. PM-2]CQR46265.1 Phosphoheptose isomerase [Paraliobacillus sp. PM-2]